MSTTSEISTELLRQISPEVAIKELLKSLVAVMLGIRFISGGILLFYRLFFDFLIPALDFVIGLLSETHRFVKLSSHLRQKIKVR
jgi:hypothetical protein